MTRWNRLSPDERRVLGAIFWSPALSRHALAAGLGFSKSKTNLLVASLIANGQLDEAGVQPSSGGRRAEMLRLGAELGVLVGVDLGATRLDVAVLRPDLTLLASHAEPADVRASPGVVLARLLAVLRGLLNDGGLAPSQVIAIGMGVPGPVDFERGQLDHPPLMPEWDGFSIRDRLREEYAAPVFVDNDVNLMALGELWRLQRSLPNFLVVKAATGIGCGVVCHGEVYRGDNGSAGDVGHICVDNAGPRCHCGNLGCVEAMAAAPAIVRMATEAAESGESEPLADALRRNGSLKTQDVGQASRIGDAAANAIIQRSGTWIGQMLASVVNFFNPSHIFIGGGLTRLGPIFLAAIRQSVYCRSLALSTRRLEIQYAPLGERGGVVGAGVLALQESMKLPGAPA